MNIRPFALNDRIDPDKDIDDRALIRTIGTIYDVQDRPRPMWEPGRFDKDKAFDVIRTYQSSRGLKPDGIVRPKGPTEKRLAAEHYALEKGAAVTPQSRILGRGANVPIRRGVGADEVNDRDDLKTSAQALTLAGYPVRGDDSASVRRQLTRFQKQQGARADGIMRPGGPTQARLSAITAPQLDHLVGPHPFKPKPFQPQKPEMVARILNFRPTTVRTFEQDPRTMATKAEYDAAKRLFERIGKAVERAQKLKMIEVAGGPRISGPAGGMRMPNWKTDDRTSNVYRQFPKPKDQPYDIPNAEDQENGDQAPNWDTIRRGLSDGQFAFGRSRIDEGDAYSGDGTYGDPDGR